MTYKLNNRSYCAKPTAFNTMRGDRNLCTRKWQTFHVVDVDSNKHNEITLENSKILSTKWCQYSLRRYGMQQLPNIPLIKL